ncbi:MAG: glycosyltransferase family 4 protein [Acidimicrobiales bacterium]|nr:glycosyltransferase family 4 protein [Acidimicrobiales bacterium]
MIRVALDGTPLLGHRTGVGVFTHEVLAELARRPGLRLTAWAATWRGRGRLAGHLPPGVRVPGMPMAARPLRAAWRRADLPPLELWTGPVDVAHGTNFVVPPTRRAARLVTVHDLTPVRFPELCTADTLQYPALLRRALRAGAHVHAVSHFVAAEVVELLGADPARVHVVPNGVTPRRPDPAAGSRPGPRVPPGGPYVLAVGTVEPRKDLPTLVRAFDLLAPGHPDLRLVLAGADGWGTAALDAAVAVARHAGRVVRVGWVGDAERDELLRGAVAVAYPSIYEGFGLPPLEAMAAGVPVVASTAGALPEVLGDAAVLVAPGDPPALAAALSGVIDSDALRRDLVARGRERAARFTWAATADGLVAIYEAVSGRTAA